MTAPAILPAKGAADRLTGVFWRKPKLLLLLLITPPLLWLGVVYLGSLFALLLQSFYSIDEFSGVVKEEFTLKTYAELFRAQNLDIILRTVVMATAVTLACAILAFPIAYYAARYAKGPWKAAFYLGVMLPLWSSYLVKVYAWKLILAKEGILGWAAESTGTSFIIDGILSIPFLEGSSLSTSPFGTFLVFVYIWLPYIAGRAGAGAEFHAGSFRRPGRDAKPDLPHGDPSLGPARSYRRVDLHLLADARRLHHPADRGGLVALHRPYGLPVAGDRREHAARRRLRRGADPDHAGLPVAGQTRGGFRCALKPPGA
jgi:hypothetical protein